MNLVVHGSRASDSLIQVDGMPIINGSGSGGLQYGNYLNNALAQEITFQTDSHNAEFERASVYSNFIPKEGSNTYRGFFGARYAGEGWQSANLDDEQKSKGLLSGNRINRIWDINPALGGPILKDRVWIYGSYRHWGTYNTVAGSFKDADFSSFFYEPSTEQNLFPVWHQSAAARLTTQINQKNKVNVYYDWQYTYFGNCFVPTYLTAISACPEYKNIPQYIIQASWSSPVTNKLLIEAGGTITPQDFHGYRRDGVSLTQFSVTDPLAPAGYPTTWGSSTAYGANRSDQLNFRGSVSYVTGSHNIKTGFTLMHSWRYTTQEVEQLGGAGAARQAAVLADAVRHADPVPRDVELQRRHLRAGSVAGQAADHELRRSARHAEGQRRRADDRERAVHAAARLRRAPSNVPNWKDIDPRFGIAYDLSGDGKTAIKTSIGRYVIGESYTIARALNPMQSTVNTGDPHVGRAGRRRLHRHLQPVRRLRPDQPGTRTRKRPGRGGVRADQQPALRPGGHAHHELRSRGGGRLARPAEQLGVPGEHPARAGPPRVGVWRLHAPLVRQPVRDQEPQRDQRGLHPLLHSGARRTIACRPAARSSAGSTTSTA